MTNENIKCAGELVAYLTECAQSHGATPHTPVYIRLGADGPMYSIGQVKMMEDLRGRAIILEGSVILGN